MLTIDLVASAVEKGHFHALVAGAMLMMIAETMLPEVYFKGGSVVGMSTLLGFLVAIFKDARIEYFYNFNYIYIYQARW